MNTRKGYAKKRERKKRVPRKNPAEIGRLIGKENHSLAQVKAFIKKIQGMVVEAKSTREIRDGYKMSPGEMVAKKKIPVIYRDSGKHYGKNPKYGCYQMCSILFEGLKGAGLRPKMTRYFVAGSPHSTVIFRLNGRLYEADPFESLVGKHAKPVEKVDDYRRKEISKMLKKGNMKFIKPGQYTKAMYDRERKTGKFSV